LTFAFDNLKKSNSSDRRRIARYLSGFVGLLLKLIVQQRRRARCSWRKCPLTFLLNRLNFALHASQAIMLGRPRSVRRPENDYGPNNGYCTLYPAWKSRVAWTLTMI